MQSDNEKMLQEIVQNTEMGKNTLDELMSLTHDQKLKDEMLRQKREYRRINQAAHTALDAIGAEAHGQRGDCLTGFLNTFHRYRHNKRQRLQQTDQLSVILGNTDMANVVVGLQLTTGAFVALAIHFQNFSFAHGGQQRKTGYLANRYLLKAFGGIFIIKKIVIE